MNTSRLLADNTADYPDAYIFADDISLTINSTLPVSLISFTGVNQNNKNILQWTTASEMNNHFFTVEKSADGINFLFMGTVKGSGSTGVVHSFSLIDSGISSRLTYYRLSQTDFNGQVRQLKTISVFCDAAADGILIYPAYAHDLINISTDENYFTIRIIDLSGKTVMLIPDSHTIDISSLPNGMYIVHVISNTSGRSAKFVKN
jgi:hypothetical protein